MSTLPPDADVVVIGGGPAGAAAAIVAARAGRQVVLVDKATFPRDKTCGDGLTTGALRLLEQLGLDPATIPSWKPVHDVHVSSPSRHLVTYPLPAGDHGLFAAIARRQELDAQLLALAGAAGATVAEGRACTGLEPGDGDVVVHVEGASPVRARWVIGADGMWSPTKRFLGVATEGYRGEWHAFRQYVRDVGPAAREGLWVWFEPDILPGYVWSFPLADGGANVGFGIRRDAGWAVGAMAALWPELLARPHIAAVLGPDATPEGPHRAWPIPARVDRTVLGSGRVLWVGDAAAATDPMTGEGIGQALATGRWAAEAILADGGPTAVVRRYEQEVAASLAVDHRMAELLVRALQHRKGARFAVWLSGLTPWTRRNFARWLFEDYPRALVATPRRWHRGMFTGPGAFRSHGHG